MSSLVYINIIHISCLSLIACMCRWHNNKNNISYYFFVCITAACVET